LLPLERTKSPAVADKKYLLNGEDLLGTRFGLRFGWELGWEFGCGFDWQYGSFWPNPFLSFMKSRLILRLSDTDCFDIIVLKKI